MCQICNGKFGAEKFWLPFSNTTKFWYKMPNTHAQQA